MLTIWRLVTKNLMHVGFNLEMEESMESCPKIGKHGLNLMQIKDQNGVLVQNGLKVKNEPNLPNNHLSKQKLQNL